MIVELCDRVARLADLGGHLVAGPAARGQQRNTHDQSEGKCGRSGGERA